MRIAFTDGIPAVMKMIIDSAPDELNDLYFKLAAYKNGYDQCSDESICEIYGNECDEKCPFNGFDADELNLDISDRIIAEIHIKTGKKNLDNISLADLDAEGLMRLAFGEGIPAAMDAIVALDTETLDNLYFELGICRYDPCDDEPVCNKYGICGDCPFDGFDADDLRLDLQTRITTEIQARIRRDQ